MAKRIWCWLFHGRHHWQTEGRFDDRLKCYIQIWECEHCSQIWIRQVKPASY